MFSIALIPGAPASPSAAGTGYVDAATLGSIALQTRAQFSSFGGIMLWWARTSRYLAENSTNHLRLSQGRLAGIW